jgi:hypothetical protein
VQLLGVSLFTVFVILQMARLRKRIGCAEALTSPLLSLAASIASSLGLCKPPRLFIHPDVQSPQAGGVLRPFVLLPAWIETAPREEQRLLLAHEIAHLKRRDPICNWLQIVAQVWMWWNPAVWWLNSRIRAEREICCDDLVLSLRLAPDTDYSRLLVDIAGRCTRREVMLEAMGMADSFHRTKARIMRVLDGKIKRRARMSVASVIVLAAFAGLALPGTKQESVADKPPVVEEPSPVLPDFQIHENRLYPFWKPPAIPLLGSWTLQIAAEVVNTGSASATAHIAFYEGDPKTGGTLIGEKDMRLAAGKNEVQVISQGPTGERIVETSPLLPPVPKVYFAAVDWAAKPGPHEVYCVLDPVNQVKEMDENNNLGQRAVNVPSLEEWRSGKAKDQAPSTAETKQTGSVSGRVLIGKEPAASTRVIFDRYDPKGDLPKGISGWDTPIHTDAEGSFRAENLPPGKYRFSRLLMWELQTADGDSTSAMGTGTHGVRVEVRPGETSEITIGGAGRAAVGRLVPETNGDGEQIKLRSIEARYFTLEEDKSDGFGGHVLVMDIYEDGTFEIPDVQPGKYNTHLTYRESMNARDRDVVLTPATYEIPATEAEQGEPYDLGGVKVRLLEKEAHERGGGPD